MTLTEMRTETAPLMDTVPAGLQRPLRVSAPESIAATAGADGHRTRPLGPSARSAILLGLMGGLWLVCVGVGMARFWRYNSTPGDTETPPATWPSGSRIPPSPDRFTLVMIAHPRCPCTRASIAELGKVMPRLAGRVSAFVVFVRPPGTQEDWVKTSTWRSASALDGVTVKRDDDGTEARIFRASTSGTVLLYGADRRLLFSGGITASRGHEGDNPGEDRLVSLVTRGSAALPSAPVFGCRLPDPEAKTQEKGGSL